MKPESFTPGTSSVRSAAVPCCGTSVGMPRPSTIVSGRVTRIGAVSLYTPGVSSRFLPTASAASIAPIDVLGEAMKNLLIGTVVPAVLPPSHDGPAESCRRAGTNTLYVPVESICRNGFSCDTGVVSSVVYGGVPPARPEVAEKLCAGAPGDPRNTWFHTPLDQPSRLVLRTMNCCCEPLITVLPVNAESAIKPPLANCGPAVQ